MGMIITAPEYVHLRENVATGMSSNGMLKWLLEENPTVENYTGYFPSDDSDLGRCERTFAALPPEGVVLAEPLMEKFRAHVKSRKEKCQQRKAEYAQKHPAPKPATDDELRQEVSTTVRDIISSLYSTLDDVKDLDRTDLEEILEQLENVQNEL